VLVQRKGVGGRKEEGMAIGLIHKHIGKDFERYEGRR
jgi:hypothetical protein